MLFWAQKGLKKGFLIIKNEPAVGSNMSEMVYSLKWIYL